ncbi:uncharacterized protein LOC128989542 [Macrosteles quadrilineatus]|uniref:uncharacterized protein LOC128989542 n=1 Tax=Macrosteles quadrilineatus TaxID=74068 RepID=UPI0023E17FEF|nr:uncharacterized protein LOC128989542 [Macrosteles quadrilineatus]
MDANVNLAEDREGWKRLELCFGDSARYVVPENSPSTMLGLLGPRYCHNSTRSPVYRILHGGSIARLVGSELWSAPALDREDLPGPLSVEVSCTLDDVTYDRVLSVTLLDTDDNLPEVLNITSTSESSEIELIDLDTFGANNFEIKLLDDTKNILQYELIASPTEYGGVEATRIKINVSVQAGRSIPEAGYTFVVRLTDKDLPPPSTVSIPLTFQPQTLLQPLAQTRPMVQYPPAVTLSRAASLHARVAEPYDLRALDSPTGPTFTLKHPSINVTERAGILYVSDPVALQRAQRVVRVTVEWREASGRRDSAQLTVELVDPDTPPCTDHDHGDNLCSALEQRECQRTTCAHGLGGRASNSSRPALRCEWLPGSTTRYSTCTVDVAHCPDYWCDPLERLSHNLTCLQDCTTHVLGAGRVRDVGQGIQPFTSGTFCSCDHSRACVCAGQPPRPPKNLMMRPITSHNKTEPLSVTSKSTQTPHNLTTTSLSLVPDIKTSESTEPKGRRREGCGFKCQTKAAIGIIFIMSSCLFFMLFLTSRRQRRKNSSRKLMDTSNTLLEAQRAADNLLQTFTHPVVSQPPEPYIVPDKRWEFPRESLIIEQCLGEGEFGRVLKARAMDIDGIKGVTTVAVKTLKVSATSAEMADLLAEYQMMKDVCHPHVVRLLGACTSLGGPVFIIIEYAEHGSLRSYLRRSRLVPPAPGSPNQAVEPLSYKSLLTFALQISKGMAYLAENKLVHRDLAARNVLLASGLLCKISDFGLSRDVYEDDAYFKRSKGRVPVKWMALESLADHVYTTKSDVWSYGVVLWELVTLGSSPYPGVAVHSLYPLLRAGYRMDRPLTCTDRLYDLMLDCWREDPLERPPFWQISARLEKLLEEDTDYLPLQLENRLVINKGYLADFSPEDDIDVLKQDFGYKIPNPHKAEKEINQTSLVKYANDMVSCKAESYDNPRPLRITSVVETISLNNLGNKHYTVLRAKPANQYQNDVQINIDGSDDPSGEKESQYETKKLLLKRMSGSYVSMNRRASSLEAGTSREVTSRKRPASYEDNNDVRAVTQDWDRHGKISGTVLDESGDMGGTVPGISGNIDGTVVNDTGTVDGTVSPGPSTVGVTVAGAFGNSETLVDEPVHIRGTVVGEPSDIRETVVDEIGNTGGTVANEHSNIEQFAGKPGDMSGTVAGSGSCSRVMNRNDATVTEEIKPGNDSITEGEIERDHPYIFVTETNV